MPTAWTEAEWHGIKRTTGGETDVFVPEDLCQVEKHGRELRIWVRSFPSLKMICRATGLIWEVDFSHEGCVFLFFHTCSHHLVLVQWSTGLPAQTCQR